MHVFKSKLTWWIPWTPCLIEVGCIGGSCGRIPSWIAFRTSQTKEISDNITTKTPIQDTPPPPQKKKSYDCNNQEVRLYLVWSRMCTDGAANK